MALLKAIRMQINSEWIKNKVTQNILKIFEGADHNAYLVGGCIRNSILNIPVTDIDISTDATPQQTVDLFNRENFKVAPTGFSHGTVTVISEGILTRSQQCALIKILMEDMLMWFFQMI